MNMQVPTGLEGDELNLGEEFDAAMREMEAEAARPEPRVDTMVRSTGIWLQRFIEFIRKVEAEVEAKKRCSAEKFEATVAAAKAEREREDIANDAKLQQLRRTFEIMDPARAKLAEIA